MSHHNLSLKQISNPPHHLSPLVTYSRILQHQPEYVDQHIFLPKHLRGPFPSSQRDLLGVLIPLLSQLLVFLLVSCDALAPEEVLHNAEPVSKSVVHRHEVLPRHEPAVMPLAPQSCLNWQAGASQETQVPPAETVTIHVRQNLVMILLGQIKPLNRLEIGAGVVARMFKAFVCAEKICETDVRPGSHPVREFVGTRDCRVLLIIREVKVVGKQSDLLVSRISVGGFGKSRVGGKLEGSSIVHSYKPMTLEGAPVGLVVASAGADAAPNDLGDLLGPGRRGILFRAHETRISVPVHWGGEKNLVVDSQLGAAEHREERLGSRDG